MIKFKKFSPPPSENTTFEYYNLGKLTSGLKVNSKTLKLLVLIMAFVFTVSLLSADCRLLALMGLNKNCLSSSTLESWNDFSEPCLSRLQDLGYYNQNGWGLLWYDYTDSGMQLNPNHIFRSHIRADQDSIFNDVMSIMYNSEPRIIMGHVRNASNLPTIDDPHPFIMRYGGKDYSFSHNWQGRCKCPYL